MHNQQKTVKGRLADSGYSFEDMSLDRGLRTSGRVKLQPPHYTEALAILEAFKYSTKVLNSFCDWRCSNGEENLWGFICNLTSLDRVHYQIGALVGDREVDMEIIYCPRCHENSVMAISQVGSHKHRNYPFFQILCEHCETNIRFSIRK